MGNFTKRAVFGLIYAATIIGASYAGPPYFYILFFIFMIFSLYEFLRIIELKSIYPYILAVASFISSIISNDKTLRFEQDINQKIVVAIFGITLFLTFITALVSSRKIAIQYLGRIFLSLIYIIIPFSVLIMVPYLNEHHTYDYSIITGIFVLIWSNDVFAYLIGKNFGKHKLIERVSPNKTIEGFIGGLVFTFVAAYLFARFFNSIETHWIALATVVSVFGVLGDLVESMFKRQANVKDSSNMIPGHGGFLDRLDSIIFVSPFIFLYLFLIL